MERIVKLHINFDMIDASIPSHEVDAAIGRLSRWGLSMYPICSIFNDGYNDMIAHYSDTYGTLRFTIGAVFGEKEQKYSFHS